MRDIWSQLTEGTTAGFSIRRTPASPYDPKLWGLWSIIQLQTLTRQEVSKELFETRSPKDQKSWWCSRTNSCFHIKVAFWDVELLTEQYEYSVCSTREKHPTATRTRWWWDHRSHFLTHFSPSLQTSHGLEAKRRHVSEPSVWHTFVFHFHEMRWKMEIWFLTRLCGDVRAGIHCLKDGGGEDRETFSGWNVETKIKIWLCFKVELYVTHAAFKAHQKGWEFWPTLQVCVFVFMWTLSTYC